MSLNIHKRRNLLQSERDESNGDNKKVEQVERTAHERIFV